MPKPKKAKKKVQSKNSLRELIKSNNYLYQFCDILQSESNKNFMDINKIIFHIMTTEQRIDQTQKMLKALFEQINLLTNSNVLDKEALENNRKQFYGEQIIKLEEKETLPMLHDNLTERCSNCKAIKSMNESACKECGFTKNKG